MRHININLDTIIEKEIKNIEIMIGRRKRNKIRINIEYTPKKTPFSNKNTIDQIALIKRKENDTSYSYKEKNYFWNKIFKKKKEKIIKEKNKKWTRKEKQIEKKNAPFKYENILEQIVEMKNNRENYKAIQEKYTGFSEEKLLTKAFQDYQNNYYNADFKNKIKRYDNNIATKEYKRKISELYRESNKNLQEISQELSEEYGMNISTSTISRYARKELNVANRREAKGGNSLRNKTL